MYYYIVDPQNLTQRQFERVQNQLHSSLSEYQILGEVTRVTSLRTVPILTESALSRGAKTIVAVGKDETLHELINSLKDSDVTLGFIPLMESEMARVLGIKSLEHACRVIATRRVTLLDLGVISQKIPGEISQVFRFAFVTSLHFGLESIESTPVSVFNFKLIRKLFSLPSFELKFYGEQHYRATLKILGGAVINARANSCLSEFSPSPADAVLDTLLLPEMGKYKRFKFRREIFNHCFENVPGVSLLHLRKMEIVSPEGLALRVGNRVVAKTPAIIEVAPQALKIIAGKERKF